MIVTAVRLCMYDNRASNTPTHVTHTSATVIDDMYVKWMGMLS